MSAGLYEIALNLLKDIGPITARNLVSYCGGVEPIFRMSKNELLKIPGIGKHRSSLSGRDDALRDAEVELHQIEKYKLETYFYLDKDYSYRLKSHQDSPLILYSIGKTDFNKDRMLAVVGTRKPTEYGRMKCQQIIRDMRDSGVTIVSGLAYGIDAESHRASLSNGLATIGILGNGLPDIYPKQHRALADKMLKSNGGLISQFPCDASPDREHFPMRNKTVAYMTDATLVIESRATGGSMITANFAFHNHRELFALPGRSIDVSSEGCNKLIKANMAQLVTDGADILKSMNWDTKRSEKAIQSSLFLELSDDEQSIVNIIKESPDIHVDLLSTQSGISTALLSSFLLQLELKGLIKQSVGKRYILAGK